MGPKHTREQILEGALAVALADGLSQVTFGRVAKHLGINDRTVVYYFPTKDDLVSAVVLSMGLELQAMVGAAFTKPAEDHVALARAAWPVLATERADPVFALFFEANGLAVAGREPYATLVPMLMTAWIDWLAPFLTGPNARRQAEAAAAVALTDGLILLRLLGGPEAADRAARRLGVR